MTEHCVGSPRAHFQETHCATSPGWRSRSLASRPISRKLSCCFSCPRSSTSFCRVPSCSAWSHVRAIAYRGEHAGLCRAPISNLCGPSRFDKETWLLSPSTAKLERQSQLTTIVLKLFSGLGFVRLTTDAMGTITETTNLTILNCMLVRLGPMGEKQLVKTLMATQVTCRSSSDRLKADDFHRWPVVFLHS